MSELELFFKQNAVEKEKVKYVVSDRFLNGDKPIEWILKPITAQLDSVLRTECMTQEVGQPPKLNTEKYLAQVVAASIEYPDLGNAKLQDSYGVRTKTDLLTAMLLPGEYQDLATQVQKVNGFKTLGQLAEKAKN